MRFLALRTRPLRSEPECWTVSCRFLSLSFASGSSTCAEASLNSGTSTITQLIVQIKTLISTLTLSTVLIVASCLEIVICSVF